VKVPTKAAAQTVSIGVSSICARAMPSRPNQSRPRPFSTIPTTQVYIGFAYFYQQVSDFKAAEASQESAGHGSVQC
jgi:type IV pilus assembly protein PilF